MRLALMALIAGVVAACTSAPKADSATLELDTAKMATVEKQANRVGVQVFWVNPPRKPASPQGI
jgi:hypothetical protein